MTIFNIGNVEVLVEDMAIEKIQGFNIQDNIGGEISFEITGAGAGGHGLDDMFKCFKNEFKRENFKKPRAKRKPSRFRADTEMESNFYLLPSQTTYTQYVNGDFESYTKELYNNDVSYATRDSINNFAWALKMAAEIYNENDQLKSIDDQILSLVKDLSFDESTVLSTEFSEKHRNILPDIIINKFRLGNHPQFYDILNIIRTQSFISYRETYDGIEINLKEGGRTGVIIGNKLLLGLLIYVLGEDHKGIFYTHELTQFSNESSDNKIKLKAIKTHVYVIAEILLALSHHYKTWMNENCFIDRFNLELNEFAGYNEFKELVQLRLDQRYNEKMSVWRGIQDEADALDAITLDFNDIE